MALFNLILCRNVSRIPTGQELPLQLLPVTSTVQNHVSFDCIIFQPNKLNKEQLRTNAITTGVTRMSV